MDKDWKIKLQEEFPFMRQNNVEEECNLYKRWGFECSGGWYQLLRECCEAIVARYAEDGIGIYDIDFEPAQIKEKFGTLRFYYGYTDAPCGIAAFDNLATGKSIRFEPKAEGDIDDTKARLRQDIRIIVRSAEKKSRHTCEVCGAEGKLKNDSDVGIGWVQTLCDSCHESRLKKNDRKKRKAKEDVSGRFSERDKK